MSAAPTRPVSQGVLLAMDAAGGEGTLALLRDGAVVAARDVVMRQQRDEAFLPAVLALLRAEGATFADVHALVVGAGPGSFTALRVVGATAKGLAHARNIPIYAVPSLALMVGAASSAAVPNSRWLATLDALRGERYAALVTLDARGQVATVEHLGLVPADRIAAQAESLHATAIGPDEAHRAQPHARGIVRCLDLANTLGAVDLASWEPMYGRLAEAQVKWEAAHGPLRG